MTNLKPIGSYKILSCYEKIKTILKGNMPIPRTLEFFISDRCNHNCPGCHSKSLHHSKYDFLNVKIAKRVVDEAAKMGVEGIEISGGGEPLMHPNIIDFIEFIHSKKIKCGLFTNGTLITNKMLPALSKLLFIRFALDSGLPSTYKETHGVDQFFKLIENIQKIVDYKKKNKSIVTIGAKFLISKANKYEIIKATKLAKNLKLDYIQFKPLRNSPKVHLNGPEIQNAKSQIKKAQDLETNDFKVIGGIEKSHINQKCILNPIHPVIDASGNVYLCAFWQHRTKTHCIGNIKKQSFEKVWYSEKHRKAFLENDYEQCNFFDCPFHAANELIQEAIVKDKAHLEFI